MKSVANRKIHGRKRFFSFSGNNSSIISCFKWSGGVFQSLSDIKSGFNLDLKNWSNPFVFLFSSFMMHTKFQVSFGDELSLENKLLSIFDGIYTLSMFRSLYKNKNSSGNAIWQGTTKATFPNKISWSIFFFNFLELVVIVCITFRNSFFPAFLCFVLYKFHWN